MEKDVTSHSGENTCMLYMRNSFSKRKMVYVFFFSWDNSTYKTSTFHNL